MAISSRQPGIYFYNASTAKVSDLPRMDVAGFIGFASNGPLHTPVLVEDMAYFRDIFGDDINLAWDAQLKRMQQSLLGSTVESFFRNGGQRCWVVRVAEEKESADSITDSVVDSMADALLSARTAARQARFAIPGLYQVGDLQPAEIFARSPGSWAKGLSLSSRLNIHSLAAGRQTKQASPDTGLLQKIGNQYQLRVRSVPGQLQPGDLLELRCIMDEPGNELIAYLFIAEQQTDAEGILVLAEEVYWFDSGVSFSSAADSADLFSPNLDSSDLDSSDMATAHTRKFPVALDESEALARYADFINTSPTQVPSLRWLFFDLLVWSGEALQCRLDGLAFHPQHERFWGYLPDDKSLFAELLYTNPVSLQPGIRQLLDDVINPRFALASNEPGKVDRNADGQLDETSSLLAFLPLSMGISSLPTRVTQADYADSAAPLANYLLDGLGTFSADLFLDKTLAGLRVSSLLAEANHQRFVRGRSLRGLHSLLSIDEISMLAVPDMLHRQWDTTPPAFDPLLRAPHLNEISAADPYGQHSLSWTPLDNALDNVRRYIVQQSLSSDFVDFTEFHIERPSPLTLENDHQWPLPPDAELPLSFTDDCTQFYFFRVRAESYGQFSAWSNSRVLRQPESSFYDCNNPDPALLGVHLTQGSSTSVETVLLQWQAEDEHSLVFDLVETYQLQRATDTDFVSAVTVYPLPDEPANLQQIERPALTDSVVYFRLRANTGQVAGPWSNTLEINPRSLSVLTLNEVVDYDDTDLRAIHFALIRLCAAKADALAVLCLPAFYQHAQALAAADDLQPISVSSGDSTLTSGFGSASVSVPGLNHSEHFALSYATLYSPWLYTPGLNSPGFYSSGAGISASGVASGQVVNRAASRAVTKTLNTINASERVRLIPPVGAVCGKLAGIANLRGAWISAENKILQDVTGLGSSSGRTIGADLELAELADKQINGITQTPGGFVVSRGFTLSRSKELQPLNVRRLLLLLRRLALREGGVYVFEPNGEDFRNRVQHYWESRLNTLYRRGALRGDSASAAYRVVTDESVNDQRNQDLGRFVVELQVAPAQPMSFIHIRLIQNGSDQLLFQEI